MSYTVRLTLEKIHEETGKRQSAQIIEANDLDFAQAKATLEDADKGFSAIKAELHSKDTE